ncbi:SDR family oxidoreductase [Variovorax sp. dw_308]|uniref:SDR family oxidoreductase n=1 Tax=Variovorax sp. dw_308 TaxID=2721546 RepID=UPI001C442501|nr:SDR family oxidoreductase [Variovorax sp. dw_308]
MNLQDKVVVVTGGASGIGAAMAQRFVAEGARVVVVADRDGARAREMADRIAAPGTRRDGPRGAVAATLDVADESALTTLIDEVENTHGPIDLFCSNAGTTIRGGPELPDADWRHVLDINLMAHVHAARALLPRMLARGGGYLLQTASAAGLLSQFDAPYAVSKHAAVAFAEWLSITYGDRGIRVSCLSPGAVDTPLLQAESQARRALMSQGVIDADAVAGIVVQGLAEERFLILTHDFVQAQVERKAADRERWIRGMRRLHAQV